MLREEVTIILLVCMTILFLLFLVTTIFCAIALYFRFNNRSKHI